MLTEESKEQKDGRSLSEPEVLALCADHICEWYRIHKRAMPWRDQPDAYKIWVSEIMLQQTRIEAAMPYYDRFIAELPDITSLAQCSQERLLKLWEGLGYYSRVRNMQACAIVLCERYDAQLPPDEEKLRALPGIGPYTAGAIGSIAFGLPVPAVDGNVMRVVSRLLALTADVMSTGARKHVEQLLRAVLPGAKPSDLNQGLMELGETICLPGTPCCADCPCQPLCKARAQGLQQQLPVRIVKTRRRIEHKAVLLFTDGRRCLLHRRDERGLLAGMYEFPALEGALEETQILEALEDRRIDPSSLTVVGDAKHIFSHIEWKMKGYEIRIPGKELDRLAGEPACCAADRRQLLEEFALPAAFAAYTDYLKRRLTT